MLGLAFGVAVSASSAGVGALQDVVDTLVRERIVHVQHADPYLLVALLMGLSPVSPEISTAGGPMPQGQTGNWLIPEGKLIVNPTDNSIIYIPKKD